MRHVLCPFTTENGMDNRERALQMYSFLVRPRALMEVLILHRSELFGAFLTGLGAEAVAGGIMAAFYEKGILFESPLSGDHRTQWVIGPAKDVFTDVRGHNHAYEIIKNHLGKATAANRGRDNNIHWGCLDCRILPFMCSDMGRLFSVLVGQAEEMARDPEWRALPQEKRPVGVAFFGEGAAQQGVIHETLNWIAASNCKRSESELRRHEKFLDSLSTETKVIRGAPCFAVVLENQFSLFTDPADEHGNSDLALRAHGYAGTMGVTVNGDNAEAVYKAGLLAIKRAQQFLSTLIIAKTYRRTGHNEDQIRRDPFKMREAREQFEKGNFEYEPDWSAATVQGVNEKEFKEQWKHEPLTVLEKNAASLGSATRDELRAIKINARKEMWTLYEKAKQEPDPIPEENEKDFSLFPPFPQYAAPVTELLVKEKKPAKRLTYNEAYVEILRRLLREDERVIFFGQDVVPGVLVPTRVLAEEFGPQRIFNVPIAEEAMASNAAGRALVGGRPIFEGQQFAPFFADAFPSLLSVSANNWYQRRLEFSYVNIFHCGVVRSGGSGEYHEAWPEKYIAPMQGVVVVAPADAYDLVGLLRASYEYDGPVAFLLQISAAGDEQFASEVPEEHYVIPLGKACVKKEGTACTVIAYGAACVRAALNEAIFLEEHAGMSVEVIDMRTVWPFDVETYARSIAKTSRLIVFHEDRESAGVGEMLIGNLMRMKGVYEYLTAEPRLVAAKNVPNSGSHALVWDKLPYEVTEIRAKDEKGRPIKRTMHRSPKLIHAIQKTLD